MHNIKRTQGIGTKQLCSLKKMLISEANQEKGFIFLVPTVQACGGMIRGCFSWSGLCSATKSLGQLTT